MCLNQPQTIPHSQSVEKLASMKLVLAPKRLGAAVVKTVTSWKTRNIGKLGDLNKGEFPYSYILQVKET